MDVNLENLLLGTFLHDIGKFMQKAKVPLSAESKVYISNTLPTQNTEKQQNHINWTWEFFQTYSDLPQDHYSQDNSANLATRHFSPLTPLQWMVSIANQLSSAVKDQTHEQGGGDNSISRLVPLQTCLSINDKPFNESVRYPLEELTSQNTSTFPDTKDISEETIDAQYIELWGKFKKDWQMHKAEGIHAVLAKIDALFERYMWCVPASQDGNGLMESLYEHSRISTAIAACLYYFHRDNGSLEKIESIQDKNEGKFLFATGDLSGIQRYIFSIAHAGGGKVSKRLRARSFYISRIPLIFAQQILHELELPHLNLILSAGGKFYLLLPNTDKTRQVLEKKEKFCQDWLFKNLQGEIALNLASVPMCGNDFTGNCFSGKFYILSELLNLKKHQPLKARVIDSDGWSIDEMILEHAKIKDQNFSGQYDIDPFYKEETLGTDLTKSHCLGIYTDTSGDFPKGDFPILDWSFSVQPNASQLKEGYTTLISFKRGAEDTRYNFSIPVFYEYRASHIPSLKKEEKQAFREKYPDEEYSDNAPLPFTILAKEGRGRDAIAYLKADVDNLGLLLRKGLSWSQSGWSLSKLAALSRSLEFFFAGRIENILKESDYRMIYTIFSGGDDVFLVGPWDTVHHFALRLHEEWNQFTANNPDFTLSVGIIPERPFSPVWAAAEKAETALESAKNEKPDHAKSPKDQVCSYGHIMKWEELEDVFQDIDKVSEWLNQKKITTAFLRNLIYFSELAARYRNDNYIEGLRYLPLLSYQVSRNIKSDDVKVWVDSLKEIDKEGIRHVGFVANYCLNLNRG